MWGGGEIIAKQTYILSDQNFPPSLPCSMGECLKIIRIENGSPNELVNTLLTVVGGGGVPAGLRCCDLLCLPHGAQGAGGVHSGFEL
jgi:hypothetical protein